MKRDDKVKRILIKTGLFAMLLFLALGATAFAADLPKEITLYYLPDTLASMGVQLPADRPSTYQFPMGSDAEYKFRGYGSNQWESTEDADCLRVSQSGLAEALPPPSTHHYPSRTVYVLENGSLVGEVKFNLVNYAPEYGSQVLDDYLANEITADMTDLEKAKKLAEIVARDFDYGRASDYVSMIVYGYGDCWASADFIIEGCRRLGIQAGYRPEPWESSSHESALVAIGDELYNIEAGFSGKKPRSYTVNSLNGDYMYGSAKGSDGTNGIALIRYERMFVEPERAAHMVVPETYDDRNSKTVPGSEPGTYVTEYEYIRDLPVLAIGDSYFRLRFCSYDTETISLPGTLEVINDYAFYNAPSLHDVALPAGLRTIGKYAFYGCGHLGDISIPGMVTALPEYAFANCGTLTIHLTDAVTKIADTAFNGTNVTIVALRVSYAVKFAQAHSLAWRSEEEILQLPDSLRAVEESAFQGTAAEGVILPEGAVSIGARAFSGCGRLKWVIVPASVTSIDPSAFEGLSGVTVAAPSGSEAEAFAARSGLAFFPLED